jgi:hypothetical protein
VAAEAIELEVRLAGAPQAAQQIERVATALDHEKAAATGAARAHEQAESSMGTMAQRGQQLTQRVQGVASAIQQLVSTTGSNDRTAGLIASVAGATAQFAAMGAALGPGGAIAGGVAGFAAGLAGIVSQANAAAAAIAHLHTVTAGTVTDLGTALGDLGGMSEDDVSRLMAEGAAERRSLMARERELVETARDIWASPSVRLEAVSELGRVRSEIETLTSRIDELNAATGVGRDTVGGTPGRVGLDVGAGGAGVGGASIARHHAGGGRSRASELREVYRGWEDAEDAFYEAERANEEARLEEIADFWEAQDDLRAASYEEAEALRRENLEREKSVIAERIEDEEAKQEAIRELNNERLAKEEEDAAAARAREIEAQTEFMELGMNVVGLMTDALGAIVSGEKTAEDAFKGLAKAFLQMISQYAMLKAATEFAEAIGAFASFNYGGGALHLAAGVAFTAVAVATGVGAAAINVAKPTAPARPEADRDSAGSKAGSGDVVINWNSPVVTAGTRDDLGRELGALVSAGRARYGDA